MNNSALDLAIDNAQVEIYNILSRGEFRHSGLAISRVDHAFHLACRDLTLRPHEDYSTFTGALTPECVTKLRKLAYHYRKNNVDLRVIRDAKRQAMTLPLREDLVPSHDDACLESVLDQETLNQFKAYLVAQGFDLEALYAMELRAEGANLADVCGEIKRKFGSDVKPNTISQRISRFRNDLRKHWPQISEILGDLSLNLELMA